MSDDIWSMDDFGFTAVNENELDVAQKAEQATTSAITNEEKVKRLHAAIKPLLENLKKNPEKDYILWPNRVNIIEKFEGHLAGIVSS